MNFIIVLLLVILILIFVSSISCICIYNHLENKIGHQKPSTELYNIIESRVPTNVDDVPLKFHYPIYYINLERNINRMRTMEKQFAKYKIKNYTRIPGVDVTNFKYNIESDYNMSNKQLGIFAAHVIAMQEFLQTDSEAVIILEDDVRFSLIPHLNFTLKDFVETKVPNDWELLSLANLLCNNNNNDKYDRGIKLYERVNEKESCWSFTAYMINRKGAEKFVNTVFKDNTIYIRRMRPDFPTYGVADDYIYALLKTYYISPSIIFPFNPEEEDTDYIANNLVSYVNIGPPELNDDFKIIPV